MYVFVPCDYWQSLTLLKLIKIYMLRYINESNAGIQSQKTDFYIVIHLFIYLLFYCERHVLLKLQYFSQACNRTPLMGVLLRGSFWLIIQRFKCK